jgi:ligand-binding sensor domain-containing protein
LICAAAWSTLSFVARRFSWVATVVLVVVPVVASPSTVERAPAGDAPVTPVLLAGPTWHPIETWRQPQGLPQNTIITITQTRDGYIWVGTKGGITRFDGVRFSTFEKRAVTETEVWDIAEAKDGSLWIGTYGFGVQHLEKGRLLPGYTKKEGLPSDFISAVAEDQTGTIWVGTDKGVSRIDPKTGAISTLTRKDGLKENVVASILCEADGSVWLGTGGGGLHLFKDGRLGENLVPGNPGSVTTLARARDGALWVGTSNAVLRQQDGTWRQFGPEDGLPDARGAKVHADAEGHVWLACQGGLYEYRDGRFERYDLVPDRTQKQGLTAVYRDHEGSLWIGHTALGLARVRRGSFVTYSLAEGLIGASVRVTFEDRQGTMWLGTSDAIVRVDQGRLRAIAAKRAVGVGVRAVSSIAQDGEGRIWYGTPDGVFRFEPKAHCPDQGPCVEDIVQMPNGAIARMNTRVLFGDKSGDVWVGTDQQGLARYHGDTVTTYTTADGLCDNGIRGLAEGPDGSLWIGTKERGVCIFKDGHFSGLTEKDGLGSDLVQDVYRGSEGSMYVATRHGLTRRRPDGRLVVYTVDDGLYADHIYGVGEDDRGNVWMGCSRGAFRVPRADLDAFADGKARSVKAWHYGIEDGLRSTVMGVGYAPTIARARDGRMWFASTDGASVVDPTDLGSNGVAPQVHVEEVSIDGVLADRTRPVQAPPGKGDLSFRYTATSFVDPRHMAFMVRLDPYDPGWVDVGNLRLRQYTNIPPGRYRFRVKASNADGVWNEAGDVFALALAPHFYQTKWFALLTLVSLGLAAGAVYRWRVASLRRSERELQVRVEQATAQIKTLRGLLPICASCKKIRDDSGYWNQMETYIHAHSAAEFSHSICPDCVQKLYPEYAAEQQKPHH